MDKINDETGELREEMKGTFKKGEQDLEIEAWACKTQCCIIGEGNAWVWRLVMRHVANGTLVA